MRLLTRSDFDGFVSAVQLKEVDNTDLGSLMLNWGGGGHRRVGTCQTPIDQADRVLERLVEQMNEDG